MFRKTETLLFLVVFATCVTARRGPHHPKSEPLGKVNEHIVHSDEHLKADLQASQVHPEKPVDQMTTEEKQFYHFKMHDYDNNNLLDGLEILQSAQVHDDSIHSHHQHHSSAPVPREHSSNQVGENEEERGIQHLVDIIDDFLLVADKNNDGFLNFAEYKETLRDSVDEQGAGDYPTIATDNESEIGDNKL